ncbi:hypothetical protein MTO96_020459 [Rhipicephalus appendiculatus]
MQATSLHSSSAWQSELSSSSDCGCEFEFSEEQPQEAPVVDGSGGGRSVDHGQQQQLFGRPTSSSQGRRERLGC